MNDDTAEKITPEEADKARKSGFDPKVVKGNELANQQTKAEFATRDARKAAEQAAPEVADLLKPAETSQWKAEDELRKGKTEAAKEPQDKALEDLKAAKDEARSADRGRRTRQERSPGCREASRRARRATDSGSEGR